MTVTNQHLDSDTSKRRPRHPSSRRRPGPPFLHAKHAALLPPYAHLASPSRPTAQEPCSLSPRADLPFLHAHTPEHDVARRHREGTACTSHGHVFSYTPSRSHDYTNRPRPNADARADLSREFESLRFVPAEDVPEWRRNIHEDQYDPDEGGRVGGGAPAGEDDSYTLKVPASQQSKQRKRRWYYRFLDPWLIGGILLIAALLAGWVFMVKSFRRCIIRNIEKMRLAKNQ